MSDDEADRTGADALAASKRHLKEAKAEAEKVGRTGALGDAGREGPPEEPPGREEGFSPS